jgi:nucleoside-diphosphate-sugar epimerase
MSAIKVLVTGVYGLIGNLVYTHLTRFPDAYKVYGSARRYQHSDRLRDEQVVDVPEKRFYLADLTDYNSIQRAVQGMDVVVHMAADASGTKGWESLHSNNVIGAYHVFEACRLAGVKRLLYASTIQVNYGYQLDEPYSAIWQGQVEDVPAQIPLVTAIMPDRPLNLYSASKIWGEALAHIYAYRHGLSCIVLRIGWVLGDDRPRQNWMHGDWCSQRDIVQLVRRCIDAPESLRYDIFYGVSDNRYRFVDIEHARQVVGYVPQDRAERTLGIE